MSEVIIAAAVRTAIGKYGGTLADISAADLGTIVVTEVIKRSMICGEDVDELIMGHVLQGGEGMNTARQVLLKSDIPVSVPAFTVNKVCGSGLKAVILGADSITTGVNNVVIAGGMENMSRAPFLLSKARWGYSLGDGELIDSVLSDALTDPLDGYHMGVTGENLAEEFRISRNEQDAFAVQSQQKAAKAVQAGKFKKEIVPVISHKKNGEVTQFIHDEFIKPKTTSEVLATLKPAFKEGGTITAGNASGINDGAAAIVLMSDEEAGNRPIQPLAKIVSYASVGVEPHKMGLGPVAATKKALAKAGLNLEDIDLIELNEAFAAQSLAVIRSLNMDIQKVNVNGGAIALGHPVGASGARILVTLLYNMLEYKSTYGLATLCVGGGQGLAMIIKRLAH